MQSIKLGKTSAVILLAVMQFCFFGAVIADFSRTAQAAPTPAQAVMVAAGDSHSLVLKLDGTVAAWGDNSFGQTTVPAGLNGVTAIAAGLFHSLALKTDGTVVAWGNNTYGQTNVPAGLNGVSVIAAGGSQSLALKTDGTVVAWGDNSFGQATVPADLSGVVSIAVGGLHSLALKTDGSVVAWGDNNFGQTDIPPDLSGVISIAAGGTHSLALKADGTVVAWGADSSGQTAVPSNLGGTVTLTAGRVFSLALKTDGTVAAWGDNANGQLNAPADLSFPDKVTMIAAGSSHSLALKADGTVAAWGLNASGQTNVPAELSSPVKRSRLAAGSYHSLALKPDGSVVAWGDNEYTQSTVPDGLNGVVSVAASSNYSLALKADGSIRVWGSSYSDNIPAELAPPAKSYMIAAGDFHSLALKSDGTVVAWGLVTTEVPSDLKDVISIAAGNAYSLALKSDGKVVAWGYNMYGQTDVPTGLTDVVAVAAGNSHAMALKSDGTVASWGLNDYGQTSIPVGLQGVLAVAAGVEHSLALKSDGTVAAWGGDGRGQTDVPAGLKGVIAIAAGSYHSLALKSDGTVVVWGDGIAGQTVIPGTGAALTALTLEEGNLNPPFQTAVAQYTYSYIGASVDKVHVAAAVNMPSQASLYINNQLQASGSATAVEVSGPSTVIPIRMEPLLLPGKTYTITVIRDSVYPVVQYGENGSLSSAKTAATLVTAADAESGLDPASLQYVWTQSPDVPASGWTSFASGDTLIRNSGDGKWYLHIQAKDLAGNRTDEVSDPFVLDNTPPVLALNGSNPMNVPVGHPYIEPGAIAEDRIDGIIPATAIAKSGRVDTASIGNYQILYEVSDHAGNQASVTRNVNVYDGDAPAVYLKGPNPMEAEAFSTFTDPGAAAVDPQDGALEPIVTGTVNTRQLGTYTLLYSAVDQANNAAPTVTRYVYVKDTAAPVITLEGDSVMVAGVGSTYQDPGARAEDLYEGDLSALISIQGTVDSSRPGTYSLNYNVIDTSNNEALSVRRLVYVIPPPVITLLGQSVIKLKAGETFTEPGAQAADAYYGDISDRITVTGSVNTQAAGTYMLRYNVQDPAGITAAEAIRTVTVENQVYYNYPPSIASGNAALKDISFVVEGKQLLSSPDGMIETTAEQIEIHALPADSGSTISLQGEALTGPITIQLSEGDNVIVISVKAPDGTVQSYTYTIHRTVYKGTNEASCAFTDIHGHWAAVQICEAASAGIVQGDPDLRFHADDAVTRAEFVVMLYRILDDSSSETTAESTAAVFTDSGDIPDWARQAIHYGVSQGIVKGYTDGAFLPNHTISRNELAVLAARTLQLQIDISSRTSFRDDSDIPIWAKPYVLASVRQGLLQGRSSNLFMPTDKTTRAEAVTLLLRMQKVLSALSAAPS